MTHFYTLRNTQPGGYAPIFKIESRCHGMQEFVPLGGPNDNDLLTIECIKNMVSNGHIIVLLPYQIGAKEKL